MPCWPPPPPPGELKRLEGVPSSDRESYRLPGVEGNGGNGLPKWCN